MKSIFDSTVRTEITNRINSLNGQNKAEWGKMNVFQMVRHCAKCDDMFLGDIKIKRVFIGRLIGKMILKKALTDNRPFGKNSPTSPLLVIQQEQGDLEQEKKEWLKRIDRYSTFSNPGFVHPFFGAMSAEQVGVFAYKHADHHLRQFGA